MSVSEVPATDLAEAFRKLTKSKKVNKFVNDKSRELQRDKFSNGERGRWKRFISLIRFNLFRFIGGTFTIYLGCLLLISNTLPDSLVQIIAAWAAFFAFALIFYFLYLLIATSLYPSTTYMNQIRCQKIVHLANEQGISVENLRKGAELSVFALSVYRQLTFGLLALVSLFGALERLFLGPGQSLLSKAFTSFFSPLPPEQSFLMVFIIYFTIFLRFIEVPFRRYSIMKFYLNKDVYTTE